MPAPVLPVAQRKALAKHSREGTATAAQRLGRFLRDDRWIGLSNPYGREASEKLNRDRKAQRAPNGRNLGQYVAASSPLHALDGWAFLSRALDATVKGDPDAARHLAYYAELRAALSLLAAQGIGVFNRTHAVVGASGDARVFGGHGTHVMVWLALRYWMDLPEAANVVGEIVEQSGERVDTWIDNLPLGGPWQALGISWLASWGIDLRDAFRDRGARNKASYAPTRIYNARPPSASDAKGFVAEWWALLEPTPAAPFETLDRHLLRASLERAFFATTGTAPRDAPDRYRSALAATKTATTGDGRIDDSLGLFLVRERDPLTTPLLTSASRHDPPEDPTQHMQVISRATLLLRLASGAASELLSRAGLVEEQVEFWTSAVGEDRALWSPGSEPDLLTDLWGDVETALGELTAIEPPPLPSYRALQEMCAPALSVLTGAERVALWAVA